MGSSWADRNSKYCCFEVSSSLTLCNKQQWMISWSDCNMGQKVDYIWPPAMTNSVTGLRRNSKVLPKAKLKLAPKKVMVTVWWSAAYQIHYSFLNPGEIVTSEKHAQQIDELHQKLQWFSSWHWSAEWAQFSTTMRYRTLHNQCFKSWMNWTVKFRLICHIHLTSCQLTTTSPSISTTFCRENASITSRMQEKFSKSSSNPKAHIFMLQK